MTFGRRAIFAVVLAGACCPLVVAHEAKSQPTKQSCLEFVREFYDWYVPKARTGTLNSEDAALNARRHAFSPQLLKHLAELDREQKRSRDAGLAFDWILNPQDPGDPGDPGYFVRSAKRNSHFCRVNVS